MNNDNNGGELDEFQSVLAAEFTDTPPEDSTPPVATEEKPVEDTPPADTPPADDKTDEQRQAEADAAQVEQEADKSKNETPEETANRQQQEAAEKSSTEAPKPLTAEDVREVLRSERSETQGRVDTLHTASKEIIDILHPDGIDSNIYDTDGKVIKTAQDIVDRKLINERTNEPFTYEEAASFMLEANQQIAKNMEELNSYAEDIAEKNISLVESNERVMGEWGHILKAMPNVAQDLASEYITTQLTFDKTGNYITNMAMSPERFYSLMMPAYQRLGEALIAKENSQAQAEADQAAADAAAEQAERTGLPPQRGTTKTNANTGDPMLDALVDELNKG